MRFAYIDSQGKEVPIPGVDALRLRIELGAIVEETMFHDESTGKWAAAGEHEIFRSIRRELGETGGGFGMPTASDSATEPLAGAAAGEPVDAAPEPDTVGPNAPGPETPEPTPSPEELRMEEPAAAEDGVHVEPMEGLEPTSHEPTSDEATGQQDPGLPEEPDASPQDEGAAGRRDGVEEVAEALGGMELAPTPEPEFQPEEPEEPRDADGAGLGTALSEYDEDQPPDWVQKESHADWASLDENPDAPGPRTGSTEDARLRRARRPRGAPRPRRLTRAGTPGVGRLLGLILVTVVVGGGGLFILDRVTGGAGGVTSVIPGIGLPFLAAELEEPLRETSAAARTAVSATLVGIPARGRLPEAPNVDWLAGVYLAGAGSFPDVAEYWDGVLAFADAAEGVEDDAFRQAFDAELARAGLSDADVEDVRDRGLAEWEESREDRAAVYEQLRAVARAALALHEFLVANQDRIDYEPAAAGVSRDPVLEAVPDTDELRSALEDRVDAVTGALDDLGYLDTMETARFLGAFLSRLESAGVD